ncbi:MAG: class I adenylate-forming enzyme family protein [Ilumatobacteraceae bacterium]|nr:acyl--CoA ligase [Ilumatobacter sp.]MCB0983488.1 acyl--CoA ligase [Ilumatobacter sp.]
MTPRLALDQLHRAALVRGDAEALTAEGARLTFGELAAEADRTAALLASLGVIAGDRVVVVLPNSAAAITTLFGVWRAGGCVVMGDADSAPSNLRYRITHSGALVVVTTSTKLPVARAALEGLEDVHVVVVDATTATLNATEHLLADAPPAPAWQVPVVDRHAPAAIIYTSGSTGPPKGVTHSHHSIAVVVQAVGDYLHHTSDDVVLCVLQLAFGYGLLQVLVTFDHGGRLVLRRGPGLPYDLVRTIATEGVTGLAGVPTLFAMLRDLDPASFAGCSRWRYLTCAAAALPATLALQVADALPFTDVIPMHGQTECFRTTYLPADELRAHPASVGRGMPGVELWLEDGEGNRLPNGSQGELIVRGENVMLGYWNDPAATAKVLRPGRTPHERVLRTGDLFRTDDDGRLYFVSRTDDIIKSRGEKISPNEIEQVLSSLPGVFECRVLGVPDDVQGQAVRAEIVVREGHELTEVDVRRTLKAALEPYKMPRDVVFVDALPKSTSGKVTRR